jgi:hypothetical protein
MQVAGLVGVAITGFVAFASLVVPARVSGATRSAKIKWQERQKEIQEAVPPAPSAESKRAASDSQSQSVPSRHE